MAVFKGNNYLLEYENVSYVFSTGEEITIGVFGGFQISIQDAKQINIFKKGYREYLSDKYPRIDFEEIPEPKTRAKKVKFAEELKGGSEENLELDNESALDAL